ncbi:MAG TPA: Ig-like domain-containing protein, partial [bacterium]|nr:Ig-like domain-containing protein [bacterium]
MKITKNLLPALVLAVFIFGCNCHSCGDGGGNTTPTTTNLVSATDPADGADGVFINRKIAATFSGEMDSATITDTTFTIMQGTTSVSGAVAYSGVTAVFTPASNLVVNTEYTATI